jgi:chorismate-pyruvate lyase
MSNELSTGAGATVAVVGAGFRAVLTTAATLVLTSAPCAAADCRTPSVWTEDFSTRLEALALLQTLNAELLSEDSATLTLEHWCAAHRLAAPALMTAERLPGGELAPLESQRRELQVGPKEPVRFRHVRLRCGSVVLSEAQNWYVPARLTPAMNVELDATDTPFGKVVRPLRFTRHTLASSLLWSPLPEGWEMRTAPPATALSGVPAAPLPDALLQHRAVLSLPDGTPFSEVVETYTAGVLAFAIPARCP